MTSTWLPQKAINGGLCTAILTRIGNDMYWALWNSVVLKECNVLDLWDFHIMRWNETLFTWRWRCTCAAATSTEARESVHSCCNSDHRSMTTLNAPPRCKVFQISIIIKLFKCHIYQWLVIPPNQSLINQSSTVDQLVGQLVVSCLVCYLVGQ